MYLLRICQWRGWESRRIWRIKWQKLWMSQFCFSLEFLSQNSLWKLSTYCGYKDIYSGVCEECEKSVFIQTRHSGDSVSQVGRSRELIARPDCQFLSYNALTIVTLQFLACFTRVALWWLASREIQSRDSFECTHLEFFSHSLTHNLYIILT